jgi:hypothetical protein
VSVLLSLLVSALLSLLVSVLLSLLVSVLLSLASVLVDRPSWPSGALVALRSSSEQ